MGVVMFVITAIVPIFFSFLFTGTNASTGLIPTSYGEPCSKEITCDSQRFLTCSRASRCTCLQPSSMTLDVPSGKCVTLVGEKCEYSSGKGKLTRTEEYPCTANASCRVGLCKCDLEFFKISNGTCHPKRNHGEECTDNKMCRSGSHLICGNGQKCVCDQNRVISESTRDCFVKAGKMCTPRDICTENSMCLGSMCSCLAGFFPRENGTCERKRSLRESCLNTGNCQDTVLIKSKLYPSLMLCIQKKCQCDPAKALESSLERKGKFCGRRLGLLCSRPQDENCVPGAHCLTASRTCECIKHSHFQVANGTCELQGSYNQRCTNSSQCDYHTKRLICDEDTKTCRCEKGRAVHPDTQKCHPSPGSLCSENDTCVPIAKCVSLSLDPYEERCKCGGGAQSSQHMDDYCYVKEGITCYGDLVNAPLTTRTCLPGLLCRNQTCTCPHKGHQIYNETKEKCVSYIAGPCGQTGDCQDRNAECVSGDSDGALRCRCKLGYIGVGRHCEIAFGGACSQRDGGSWCDTVAPLECSSRGICECSDLQVYDSHSLTCRGLVGARCNTLRGDGNHNGFCVEGAMCQNIRGFDKLAGVCVCEPGWRMQTNGSCQREEGRAGITNVSRGGLNNHGRII